jgi:hypothetical protein
VEAPGQRPDPLRQRRLEVHVDVFERRVPDDGSGLDLGAQPLQAGHERRHFVGPEQSGPAQSVDVGDRAGDVVGRKRASRDRSSG